MYIRFDVACRKPASTLNEGAREGAFPKGREELGEGGSDTYAR